MEGTASGKGSAVAGRSAGCDREGGDEDSPLVNQDGCGRFYGLVEACLGENDRDWRKCQAPLKAWRECHAAALKGERGKESPAGGATATATSS